MFDQLHVDWRRQPPLPSASGLVWFNGVVAAPRFPTVPLCVKSRRKILSSLHNSQQRAPSSRPNVRSDSGTTASAAAAADLNPPLEPPASPEERLLVASDQLGLFGAPGNDPHASEPEPNKPESIFSLQLQL